MGVWQGVWAMPIVEIPVSERIASASADGGEPRPAALFRETPSEAARRRIMGAACACHPKHASDLLLLL